ALERYANNMEHIRVTPIPDINPRAIVEVLQYFGDASVDYNRIMEYGFLNVPGRPIGIATLLKSMAQQAVKGKYIYAKSSTQGGRGTIVPFDIDRHGLSHTRGTTKDVYGYRPRVDNINRR